MKGAIERDLIAGASNVKDNKDQVIILLEGDEIKIKEMIEKMKSGILLNNKGAKVIKVVEEISGPPLLEFQYVSLDFTLDDFRNPSLLFFL